MTRMTVISRWGGASPRKESPARVNSARGFGLTVKLLTLERQGLLLPK